MYRLNEKVVPFLQKYWLELGGVTLGIVFGIATIVKIRTGIWLWQYEPIRMSLLALLPWVLGFSGAGIAFIVVFWMEAREHNKEFHQALGSGWR